MNKTYVKIIIKEIKSTFGRFAAIFGIVALSVGFLSGLLATTPDMKSTVDEYYDKNNMSDIFIKATMGLTEKDIAALSSFDEVEELMPAYVTDALLETDNNEVLTSRILGLPLLNKNKGMNFINNLNIISGRMPQNENECVVEKSGGYISGIELGRKLSISKENEDYGNIGDTYKTMEYTVVGIVSNPFYFSVESERSSIGNGKIGAIVYVDEKCYNLDVYTDFYIKAKDASKLTAFTDEYENYIENVSEKLKAAGKKQSVIRDADIKNEANDKLNKAKAEYEDGKKDADKELADAAKKIEDGKVKLSDAAADLKDGKIKLTDAKSTLKKETADAQKKIDDGYAELNDAKVELDDGEKEYSDGLTELTDGEKKYSDGMIELADGQKKYDDGMKKFLDSEQELKDGQAEFDKGEQEYLDGLEKLEAGKSKIRKGASELSSAKNQLVQAEAQYDSGVKQLAEQKTQFENLMTPILGTLNSYGYAFSSSEELFNAMEADGSATTETAISAAVTGTLGGIRNQIKDQIDYLEGASTGSESQTAAIDALKANLNGIPENAQELMVSWKMLKDGEETLASSKKQIDSGWSQYESGLSKLNQGKRKLKDAEKELADAKVKIEENRIKLADGWKELEKGRVELEDARIKLEDGYKEAADSRKKLDDGHTELVDARKELDDGWAKYYDGLEELSQAKVTLKNEVAEGNKKIQDGEDDLLQGQLDYDKGAAELTDGENKYLKAKVDAEKKLNDGAVKIQDAQKDIANLDTPEWYVLDRNSNVSYASFAVNVEKVADVCKVFPVFFFLIAALVTLTTMTRMVEEERTQMGTLKALGYRKGAIISKYIIYCGLASTLGSIVGLFGGFSLLPKVIWNAYRSMYHLPELSNKFLWQYALPIALISIISTISVTIYVCYNSLKEKPSTLMLPRAPKSGKRILLERIDFIWSRMKFSQKSTARNIMRYKRHLFMTVIGISGCTALLLTGFGLLDSIKSVANTQFSEIFKYDFSIYLDDKEERDDVLDKFLKEKAESYAESFTETGYIYNDNEKLTATICVPSDPDDFMNAVCLRDRKSGNEIAFNDSSVIVTEKLADSLNLKVGDTIMVENYDGKKVEFVLTGITENYVGIYIYINKADYSQAFNKKLSYNTIMVNSAVKDGKQLDEAITEVLKSDCVMNVETVAQIKESFDNLLSNINFIVIVLILAAGALAIIVLYNLTNININERRKELSTLKVLGYHNEEVAAYVFRETTILSIIGTFVGLFLGVILHVFIVKTVEASNLMLGRNISFLSYVYSAVITMFFSMIVNIIMYRKLKKIEMVESMKAIE